MGIHGVGISFISDGARIGYFPTTQTVTVRGEIGVLLAIALRRYIDSPFPLETGSAINTQIIAESSPLGSSNIVISNYKFPVAILIDSENPEPLFLPKTAMKLPMNSNGI